MRTALAAVNQEPTTRGYAARLAMERISKKTVGEWLGEFERLRR